VIAALVYLQVGSASQGDLDFDKNFAVSHPGDWHSFNLHVLFTIEDCSGHLSVHSGVPSLELPGCITIFMDSGLGWAARFKASTLLDKEKR